MARLSRKKKSNGAESISDFHADLRGTTPRYVRAKERFNDERSEDILTVFLLENPFDSIREFGCVRGVKCA